MSKISRLLEILGFSRSHEILAGQLVKPIEPAPGPVMAADVENLRKAREKRERRQKKRGIDAKARMSGKGTV